MTLTKIDKIKLLIDRSSLFEKESIKINSDYAIGYRNYFENFINQIVIGRERNIILPKDIHTDCYFALVELESIIASHNEITFKNSDKYPVLNGLNVNDRNYETDKNAQLAVMQIAERLNPDIIISTSATSSGTPIISVDGIVVSGNNRVMSLKLAKEEVYENYKTTLYKELIAGGYFSKFLLENTNLNNSWIFISEDSSFNNPKRIEIKNPILVRIDPNIPGYSKEVLNVFNVARGKSERPIDMASRISQQLLDRKECSTKLLSLIDNLESPTDLFYSNDLIKKYKSILLECNLVSERELPKHFSESGVTEDGKIFYRRLLLSLILTPKNVEISEGAGMRSYRNLLENAIIPLSKIKFINSDLIYDINEAFVLINKMNASEMKIEEYITNLSLFEDNINIRSAELINLMSNLGSKKFKEIIIAYLNALDANKEGPGMFPEEHLEEKEIFKKIITSQITDKMKKSLERLNSLNLNLEVVHDELKELIIILEQDMNNAPSGDKSVYLKAIEELKKQYD